ncbi:MAG: 50S ribosomal protein L21 [Atopobiaceae bacterium]|nr:50S ribosomal protein L21 [Atopobiaceae bacterium]
MYAIVSTGGKQYKVAQGDVIDVEKLNAQPGDKVELDVLMLNDGATSIIDPAALESKKVTAEVLEQFKDKKVIVYKFKKRKRYHRTRGHRQNLTKLKVVELPIEEPATSVSTDDAAED